MECAQCKKPCNIEETLYKIKHKDTLYCFCCPDCKKTFQLQKFGEIIY